MFIMNIGLPGSGKSTLLKKLGLPDPGFVIVSPDKIRSELFGVIFNKTVEPQVWVIVKALVEGHLRLGWSVAFDSTNLTRERRCPWIELARRYGQKVLGIFFNVPLKQVQHRNKLRPGEWIVPGDIIASMYHSLQVPVLEEGFHKIITVSGSRDEAGIQKVRDSITSVMAEEKNNNVN